jgi:hypothetical protein
MWVPVLVAEATKMKIYFLLMIVSVFVAFSYMPIRSEAKQSSIAARLRTRVLPSR